MQTRSSCRAPPAGLAQPSLLAAHRFWAQRLLSLLRTAVASAASRLSLNFQIHAFHGQGFLVSFSLKDSMHADKVTDYQHAA